MTAHLADDLPYRSVAELSYLIHTKRVSPVELARMHLERAQKLDPHLFAFVTFTEDLAMEQARAAERSATKGKLRSRVDGIPWGVKDLFATAGIPTQWDPSRGKRLASFAANSTCPPFRKC
jgi:amidase